MDEALEWVKRIPTGGAETEIELRRVFESEDFGDEFTPEVRAQEERLRAEIAGKSESDHEPAAARSERACDS